MIPQITEVNFPSYATLSQATVSITDMGEKTITTQVKIDGNIAPDFSFNWVVMYNGEKYIHPLRNPQSEKVNTSSLSTVDLTFYHWAIYELKRYYFMEMTSIDSSTAIANKYEASLSLNLSDFRAAFNNVLQYYFKGAITMDLYEGYAYDQAPTAVSINYAKIWDVLTQMYDLYAVRWDIVPDSDDVGKYIIRVGYPTFEMERLFEYGFEGGLLKFEQQVQNPDIRNVILGRGGEKNLPQRYFKDLDADNPTFPADPDAIDELENIHFDRLRDINFRYYIEGWKDHKANKPRRYPNQNSTTAIIKLSEIPWAYEKGYTDETFDPVEYVKDDESITHYGEIWGAEEDNDEVYPTIQGVVVDGIGRVDEAVDVEQIVSDEVKKAVESDAIISYNGGAEKTETTQKFANWGNYKAILLRSKSFVIPAKMTSIIECSIPSIKGQYSTSTIKENVDGNGGFSQTIRSGWKDIDSSCLHVQSNYEIKLYDYYTHEYLGQSVTAGDSGRTLYYTVEAKYKVDNFDFSGGDSSINNCNVRVTVSVGNVKITSGNIESTKWKNTFDIWVKDIWQSSRQTEQSDQEFADSVWKPILGDQQGNEAKVVFSDGRLGVSEDYEFTIVDYAYDTSKTLNNVSSMWRLTLAKSEADLESIGLYVPSTKRQGAAGDHFFFTGIDMPFQYVVWAEQKLNALKTDALNENKDILPTKVVTLDKVRANTALGDEVMPYISSLSVGAKIRVADKRFISAPYESVYVQSITYTFNETQDNANLLPDVEVVLSNDIVATATTTQQIQYDINAINRTLGALSNVESVVRAIGDKLYLRKDGFSDLSISPTRFGAMVSNDDFRQGRIGGRGWGLYKDDNGNTVFEADRMVLRQSLDVNTLAIHQTEYIGGSYIESAAGMTCTDVADVVNAYVCFFDQKEGTIQNHFKVGDVAYSQSFREDNTQLAFYKRRVIGVGQDYIMLSKTEVNGDGVPCAGDVIIQYGSYTDANRRYVKIRDVVGGGYERFLENLDSVNATGDEYYFAGKQIGTSGNVSTYRLFIGNQDSDYLEWKEGQLTIKGVLKVSSGQDVESIITSTARSNLAKGTSNSVYVETQLGTPLTKLYDIASVDDNTTLSVSFIVSDYRVDRAGTNGLRFWICSSETDKIQLTRFLGGDVITSDGRWWTTVNVGSLPSSGDGQLYLAVDCPGYTTYATISEVMVVIKGSASLDWSPRPADFDYLSQALKQSTTIAGGLIQTSAVQTGYNEGGNFRTLAGTNGLPYAETPEKSIAFWGGGNMVDPENSGGNTPATFGVRMDGSVWAAKNTVTIDDNKIKVGDNIVLDSGGIKLINGSNIPMTIENRAITSNDIANATATEINLSKSINYEGNIFSDPATKTYYQYYVNSTNGTQISSKTIVVNSGTATVVIPQITMSLPTKVYYPSSANISVVLPKLVVKVLKNGVLKQSVTISPYKVTPSTTNAGWNDATAYYKMSTFTAPLNSTGQWIISLSFMHYKESTSPDDMASVAGTCSVSATGNSIPTNSSKTVIGNNGLASIWPNGSMIMTPGFFMVIQNQTYGLKIDSTGVYVCKDGGAGTWKSLTD